MDPIPKTAAELAEEARLQLESEANAANIRREQGDYVPTYKDESGRAFFYTFDRELGKRVRSYLADGELPPKAGEEGSE